MLSFKYLSMAFRESGKPGQDVCWILLEKNRSKRTLLCVFVFRPGRLYVVSECL
jgi:hypothetical protein